MSQPDRPSLGSRFIGRTAELATLSGALALARKGQGRVVMLAGEPGIGKTCTAQRAAEAAAEDGMLVLWGRCPEEPGAPPYWPWRQALRRCAASWDDITLRETANSAAGELAAFDPDLARRLTAPMPPAQESGAAAAEARFRLFDAVAGFWQRAARRQPVLLVLDDLHRADVPSLKLLEFIAAELHTTPLMVLGTYRDAEVGRTHPLSDALSQSSRHAPVQRLKLSGFSAAETAQFIEQIANGWAPKLAPVLHERTDGHPLFLIEIARHLEETCHGARHADARPPDLARLPAGAREVIGSRLGRLSLACGRVLSDAAVIGRSFSRALLTPLLDEISPEQCLHALDEARRASLIEPLAEADTFQFTHALVRDALYEEMPAPRRTRLHRRIATNLEGQHRADPTPALSALAYHYFEARSTGVGPKAVEYARRAAAHATSNAAYEDAVVHLQRALQALDGGADEERCELLLALGAAYTKTADTQSARNTFTEAARLARRLAAPHAMARAALGYETVSWRDENVGAVAAALLKEALLMGSPLDSRERALLFAALCRALAHAGHVGAAAAMHDTAVAMARRIGDTEALFMALASIVPVQWVPKLLPARLVAGREALQLAMRAGNSEWAFDHLSGWHIADLLESGDIDAAIEAAGFGADRLSIRRQPYIGAVVLGVRAMLALHQGRFVEAEQLIVQNTQQASRYNFAAGLGAASMQMFSLRREQGRLAEVAPAMDVFRRTTPEGGTWLPGYAMLCCELNRHDDAAGAFEQLARDGFANRPGPKLLLRNLAFLAETCAWLDDAARAEPLYATIGRYAGRNLCFGNVMCYGSADRFLGMLAATTKQWDAAEQHFERALTADALSRGLPWLAHTRYQYAAMLQERKRPGDAERAAVLLQGAIRLCRELGMVMLEQRAHALEQPAAAAGLAKPAGLSGREVQVLQMVAEGKTNQEIAGALFRSANTVANHVRNILAKIDCTNRTEAAAFAVRHGLVGGHSAPR